MNKIHIWYKSANSAQIASIIIGYAKNDRALAENIPRGSFIPLNAPAK